MRMRVGISRACGVCVALVGLVALTQAATAPQAASDPWKATGEAYRRVVLLDLPPQSLARELVSSVDFVQERSPSVDARMRHRGGARRVVVTTAWMSTMKELMHAAAVASVARNPDCFAGFLAQQADALSPPEGGALAWSRRIAAQPFGDYAESSAGRACKGITRRLRHGPAVAAATQAGMDAAMSLVVGRALEPLAVAPGPADARGTAASATCAPPPHELRVIETMSKLRIDAAPLAPLYLLEARVRGASLPGCGTQRERAEAYLALLPTSARESSKPWVQALWPN
ncbi:hypothetical protein [Aquabacterium humicola]|uniref:hypothetical protein n=1 Tax=Aquabacterium humicola TaxID=3237377 RepID=UPI002542CC5F|nr:hypothetical protein [Rubrivivax pictus]